jgi:hypothetical protein
MLRVSVVDGYLFALLNIAQGKEDNPVSRRAAHVGIRLAGMIDVSSLRAADRAVYRNLVVNPDNLYDALPSQSGLDSAFATDQFACIVCNLLPLNKRDEGKAALPINVALFDFKFPGHLPPFALTLTFR